MTSNLSAMQSALLDARSHKVVPVSPSSKGFPLLVDGAVYARFGTEAEAWEAQDMLRKYWPVATSRTVTT